MKNYNKQLAQSLVQYILLITLVAMGIYTMTPYTIRAINAHFKFWEDQVQDSYDDPLVQAKPDEVDLPAGCVCADWEIKDCNLTPCKAGFHLVEKRCTPSGCATANTPPDPLAEFVECNATETQCCWADEENCCTEPVLTDQCGTELPARSNPPAPAYRDPLPSGGCAIGERVYEYICGANVKKIKCKEDHDSTDGDRDCRGLCLGQQPPHSAICCQGTIPCCEGPNCAPTDNIIKDDDPNILTEDLNYMAVGTNASKCTTDRKCEIYCPEGDYPPNANKSACEKPMCKPPIKVQTFDTGNYHNCVILKDDQFDIYRMPPSKDGDVHCWGYYQHAGLAEGYTHTDFRDKAVSISSGPRADCILRADGNVHCWGVSTTGQLNAPDFLGEAIAVSVGWDHACALVTNTASRTVQCWGSNSQGQAGIYVPPINTTIVDVSAGAFSTCALLDNGDVDCWGRFMVPLGTATQAADYTATPGKKAVQISVGAFHACALLEDDNVHCWGDPRAGNAINDYDHPSLKVISINAGFNGSAAVLENGNVHYWGPFMPTDDDPGIDAVAVSTDGGYQAGPTPDFYQCILRKTGQIDCSGISGSGANTDFCCSDIAGNFCSDCSDACGSSGVVDKLMFNAVSGGSTVLTQLTNNTNNNAFLEEFSPNLIRIVRPCQTQYTSPSRPLQMAARKFDDIWNILKLPHCARAATNTVYTPPCGCYWCPYGGRSVTVAGGHIYKSCFVPPDQYAAVYSEIDNLWFPAYEGDEIFCSFTNGYTLFEQRYKVRFVKHNCTLEDMQNGVCKPITVLNGNGCNCPSAGQGYCRASDGNFGMGCVINAPKDCSGRWPSYNGFNIYDASNGGYEGSFTCSLFIPAGPRGGGSSVSCPWQSYNVPNFEDSSKYTDYSP